MRCSKCNNEISPNVKYCIHCGNEVSQAVDVVTKKEETPPANVMSSTKLSIGALIFLLVRVSLIFSIINKVTTSDFVLIFPGTIISLILAIISRKKYKDKLSLPLIIIDIVVIVIEIVFFITMVLLLAFMFKLGISAIIDFFEKLNGFPW